MQKESICVHASDVQHFEQAVKGLNAIDQRISFVKKSIAEEPDEFIYEVEFKDSYNLYYLGRRVQTLKDIALRQSLNAH